MIATHKTNVWPKFNLVRTTNYGSENLAYFKFVENLRIGNGGGKKGRGNQPPNRRYGPDTDIQYRPRNPPEHAKPSRNASKREADTEFSIDPTSSIRTSIADAIFADAISETSREGTTKIMSDTLNLVRSTNKLRNARVTPTPPHTRQNMNKHLDKLWPKMLQSKANVSLISPTRWSFSLHWEIKGRVRKRVVLAKVPSFRFSFRGNMRTYPRSGFRSGGTSECTLGPVFVPGKHPPNHPFGKPPFCQPQISAPFLTPTLPLHLSIWNGIIGGLLPRDNLLRECWGREETLSHKTFKMCHRLSERVYLTLHLVSRHLGYTSSRCLRHRTHRFSSSLRVRWLSIWFLAHRNRSDFCDFCDCDAHRGPQKSRNFRGKRKQCCIAIQGCDGESLAICDFGLRFLRPKPHFSAGFLAIWLSQRGNR